MWHQTDWFGGRCGRDSSGKPEARWPDNNRVRVDGLAANNPTLTLRSAGCVQAQMSGAAQTHRLNLIVLLTLLRQGFGG